jgi:hypothetical protein
LRVVVPAGSLPWSACPIRIEKNGIAIAMMSTAAPMPSGKRRLATTSDQRAHAPTLVLGTNVPSLMARRCLRGSTFSPRKLSSAGSRVSEATIVRHTATATPIAMP